MQTDIAIKPRMGRPALGLTATAVRLAPEVLERIDAIKGKHRRAIFIREAVEEKLTAVEAELARRKP